MESRRINHPVQNAAFIEKEVAWLREVFAVQLDNYFNGKSGQTGSYEVPPPETTNVHNAYEGFIIRNKLNAQDRVLLLLALMPLIEPSFFSLNLSKYQDSDHRCSSVGLINTSRQNALMPTLETLLFILASSALSSRVWYMNYFSKNHFLIRNKLVILEINAGEEFPQSIPILPSAELIDTVLLGKLYIPAFSPEFPATRLTTAQDWEDLVLDDFTLEQIDEIRAWIEVGNQMLDEWNLRKKMKPGFRSLFFGPSGTGKSFTAALLGKYTGRDVYRIDLSAIVSKYIGETEKNLAKVFDKAEDKDWILFFDEADALFGKRTEVKDAHDRYANQEVAYLLQRVEDYNGVVILSTNLKTNIDDSFSRRFQSIIRFNLPDASQRKILWNKLFSDKTRLAVDIDLKEIASKYEMTGGAILNVVRYCSLMARRLNTNLIDRDLLLKGIRKEYAKEGRSL